MRLLADAELVSAYVTQRSEEAFATLVERHVSLVYSSALRQVRNPDLAQEITQAVFVILAHKAASLRRETVLAGWLCRTTHFTACNALKAERRRQQREQEAYMNSLLNEPEPEVWPQIRPLLDEGVAQLDKADRNAVVLRFYEHRPFEEVGSVLGLSADAAQKRVSRALEKLRKFFVKRGVTLTATAIAGAVAANSVQAAPAGLVVTITAAAAKGAAVGGSTLTLVKGALTIIAWTKAKTVIVVAAAAILAAGTTTVAIHKLNNRRSYQDTELAGSWQIVVPRRPGRSDLIQTYKFSPDHTFTLSTVSSKDLRVFGDWAMQADQLAITVRSNSFFPAIVVSNRTMAQIIKLTDSVLILKDRDSNDRPRERAFRRLE
jgi:RNA polymerase sigma factor (sigma-70 family)